MGSGQGCPCVAVGAWGADFYSPWSAASAKRLASIRDWPEGALAWICPTAAELLQRQGELRKVDLADCEAKLPLPGRALTSSGEHRVRNRRALPAPEPLQLRKANGCRRGEIAATGWASKRGIRIGVESADS